jgi:hypothetical protein
VSLKPDDKRAAKPLKGWDHFIDPTVALTSSITSGRAGDKSTG